MEFIKIRFFPKYFNRNHYLGILEYELNDFFGKILVLSTEMVPAARCDSNLYVKQYIKNSFNGIRTLKDVQQNSNRL